MLQTTAQIVYFPTASSQLLRSTASDVAMLLQKSIPGSSFSIQGYSHLPEEGIILVYDSLITDNQSCRVVSNGTSFVKFTADQDNGLDFGIYQYLQNLGFRFYQPGSIWETIPVLSSPFKVIDSIYSCSFKYKNWFISGGHNLWVMDNDQNYGWESYFGQNGHNWALYQRRNGMTGGYHFAGHRGDLMTSGYLASLQAQPCLVACYNGARIANPSSVPDMNNTLSMQQWSSAIAQQYAQYRDIIYNNKNLYANIYRNFNYYNGHIGIEVPDGAQWGNSRDNTGCNSIDYPTETDQHIVLANYTVNKLSSIFPGKRFQLYAYAAHADQPAANISINDKIDVQVIATAFQNESSAKGLLNRWYNRTGNISEYHYMNIPQWGGETPMFYLEDLKATLQRSKEKNNQGIVWEASPAKFASLPFLLAANNELKDHIQLETTLQAFCNDMFANANNNIFELLKLWTDDKSVTTGNFIQDNKYKIPYYLQLLSKADNQTKNAIPIVKARLSELKAYLHYMVLYYDWLFDQNSNSVKSSKAAALCVYLAKINKLLIVNSYFLIADITSRYATQDIFYKQYNVVNGTAYQNGTLPLITPEEIELNFQQDIALQSNLIGSYQLKSASFVKDQFVNGNIDPLKKISVSITYTNGYNYPNRSEFYFIAPGPGNFNIQYNPHFYIPGKGYINFTVEANNTAFGVIKDFSLDNNSLAGAVNISIPAAGIYKLSVVSKFKSGVDLEILTNGNYFYKNGPFLGTATENYRNNLLSLPGYFYVPVGSSKIYFSVNNSNPGGIGFATTDAISKAFVFKDNYGKIVQPYLVSTNDSALFYLDVPIGDDGTFWQVCKMEQYNLCFANISNLQWFAERKQCPNADFTVSVLKENNGCLTQLSATTKNVNLRWEINELNRNYSIENESVIKLPNYFSPNTIATLYSGSNCVVTKRIGDDKNYLFALQTCAMGALMQNNSSVPILYPNPSKGIFYCQKNGELINAEGILITNAQGENVGLFSNVKQINIGNLAGGVYWYRLMLNGVFYTGKLVKQ